MDVPIGMCKPDPAGKSTGPRFRDLMTRASARKVADPRLPRKASKESVGDRTANRHR